MGIRIHCPNGHRLNVKAFLAGKRGVCPHCGAKFEIPAHQTPSPGDTTGDEISTVPSAAPEATDVSGVSPGLGVDAPAGSKDSIAKRAAVGAAPVGFKASFGVGDSSTPIQESPITGAARSAPPTELASSTPSAGPDPLEQAPGASWYVRHSEHGQFGPATADQLRQWAAEGRLAADWLVWRKGWDDWQPATMVLPDLDAPPAELGTGLFSSESSDLDTLGFAAPGRVAYGHSGLGRRRTHQTTRIVSAVLAGAALVLLIVLVYVLTR